MNNYFFINENETFLSRSDILFSNSKILVLEKCRSVYTIKRPAKVEIING